MVHLTSFLFDFLLDSTCQTCGEMCKLPVAEGGKAGVCDHKYKCVLKPTNPDEPICSKLFINKYVT